MLLHPREPALVEETRSAATFSSPSGELEANGEKATPSRTATASARR